MMAEEKSKDRLKKFVNAATDETDWKNEECKFNFRQKMCR